MSLSELLVNTTKKAVVPKSFQDVTLFPIILYPYDPPTNIFAGLVPMFRVPVFTPDLPNTLRGTAVS